MHTGRWRRSQYRAQRHAARDGENAGADFSHRERFGRDRRHSLSGLGSSTVLSNTLRATYCLPLAGPAFCFISDARSTSIMGRPKGSWPPSIHCALLFSTRYFIHACVYALQMLTLVSCLVSRSVTPHAPPRVTRQSTLNSNTRIYHIVTIISEYRWPALHTIS